MKLLLPALIALGLIATLGTPASAQGYVWRPAPYPGNQAYVGPGFMRKHFILPPRGPCGYFACPRGPYAGAPRRY